jgi:thioredoxin-related protein
MLTASPALAQSDGITWLRSAEQAAELSRKTGRPILIYCRSESCHYCDLMQREVWQDPTTADIITREFVPLKLTREENKEAVEAMKVKGYPSTVIFSADRKYLTRVDGYLPNEKFLSAISSIRTAAAERSMRR